MLTVCIAVQLLYPHQANDTSVRKTLPTKAAFKMTSAYLNFNLVYPDFYFNDVKLYSGNVLAKYKTFSFGADIWHAVNRYFYLNLNFTQVNYNMALLNQYSTYGQDNKEAYWEFLVLNDIRSSRLGFNLGTGYSFSSREKNSKKRSTKVSLIGYMGARASLVKNIWVGIGEVVDYTPPDQASVGDIYIPVTQDEIKRLNFIYGGIVQISVNRISFSWAIESQHIEYSPLESVGIRKMTARELMIRYGLGVWF
jgi:hypothetical protein